MVDVTTLPDPTLAAVAEQMVLDSPPDRRVYLGASVIGKSCWRQLWYDFRWVLESIHDAETLARFADGHASEEIVINRLKAVPGVRMWSEQEDGGQYGFEDLGGHFRGHLDGIIAPLQAPKTRHVYEHKCVNTRKFNKLEKLKIEHGEKRALAVWDDIYYAQAIVYMGEFGLSHHYLTVSTPGSRELTSCLTDFDDNAYERIMGKAKRIIYSPTPLERISPKPDYFVCNWCTYKENCHGQKVARVNCRTCAHVTPIKSGAWKCEFHNKALSKKEQRSGCKNHLFIPDLVPFGNVTDMDKEANTISYQTDAGTPFINAETNDWANAQFSGKDLQHLDAELLDGDTDFFSAMSRFDGATIESVIKSKEKQKPVKASDISS